jgi:hypothetical protein
MTDRDAASVRRFPPPWQVEQIPGGFKVLDASGQALVYVYARETREQGDIAMVLTFDEARRIAALLPREGRAYHRRIMRQGCGAPPTRPQSALATGCGRAASFGLAPEFASLPLVVALRLTVYVSGDDVVPQDRR